MQSVIGPSSFAGSSVMKWPFGVIPGWDNAFIPSNLQVIDVGYLCGGDVTLKEAFPLAEGYP